MKKIFIVITSLVLFMLAGINLKAAEYSSWKDISNHKYTQVDTEFRAVWVATVYNIDMPVIKGSTQKDIEDWKAYYIQILDKVEMYNMNAVVFQIRPCNDAFYPSKYNPWSEYLFGGKDPGFDPLEWMIEVTHERGIEYHAWLNPYRASTKVGTSINVNTAATGANPLYHVYDYDNDVIQNHKKNYFSSLKASSGYTNDGSLIDNPVFAEDSQLINNVVLGAEDMYVLNPASPNTKKHIENTIEEIVDNYDVDGIHFDDYFYPNDNPYIASGTNPNFKGHTFSTEPLIEYEEYNAYKNSGGTLDLYNWRRDNVNRLIESLSKIIREKNQTKEIPCAFGISPCARWAPSIESCPAGSPRPAEGGMYGSCGNYYAYSDLYADTKKWVVEGWLDYILPQNYTFLNDTYREIVDWWDLVVENTNVKLFMGTSLDSLETWGSTSTLEISHQLRYNSSKSPNVIGYSLFSYKSLESEYGKRGIENVVQYNWKTNALTPLYDNYNYKDTVSELAKVDVIEEISDGTLRINFNKVDDAKAYGLYKVEKTDVVTDELLTADKLVKLSLKAKNYFEINDYDETFDYYIVTYSMDNSKHIGEKIDFTKTEYNVEPTIEMITEFKTNVLIDSMLTMSFELNDENNDKLSVEVFLVRRKEEPITNFTLENNILTINWQTYSVSTNNIKFKIIVSDGKTFITYETETFNVIDCNHNYSDATCNNPQTCINCGLTVGSALGHNMEKATCENPSKCSRCDYTEGESLGHTWMDATCESAKTCTVCKKTTGNALGHIWEQATTEKPKTCSVCGKTEGEKLPPAVNPQEPNKKGCKKTNITIMILSVNLIAITTLLLRKKN